MGQASRAPGSLTAIILDFDGLMVDTESSAFESWRLVFAEHGQVLTMETWAGALGTNHGFNALEHLLRLVVASDPQRADDLRTQSAAIVARRQQLKDQLVIHQTLLPGVRDLLDQARTMCLPLAVASSSSRRWVEGWLEQLEVRHYFDCVCTADDVQYTKPDPALFLQAAACLGRAPGACLVFEDSPNGILAAHAAGCRVVAVPGAISSQMRLPPADLLLADLAAQPLSAILALLDESGAAA
jgi:putative hydrolase of the HAD superfamily